ncbi:MAG: hypothetical protein EU529_08400 [Promethearchaeota archaeon]|nr:MAG: hypothetical protein EU529_08400 [Candidatus Lokiarchaeota archaeon]
MDNEKKLDDAMKSYEKVRESLTGLYEIININLSNKDFFYKVAIDNLKALNENIIDILKQSNTPREVRMRLRKLHNDEIDAEKHFPL